MSTVSKLPLEKLTLYFDFTARIPTGKTITSVQSLVCANILALGVPSTDITITGQTVSGLIVYADFAGGVAGQNYKSTCRIVLSDGQILELDGDLAVNFA